jgi:hypothetical protein
MGEVLGENKNESERVRMNERKYRGKYKYEGWYINWIFTLISINNPQI